MLRVKNFRGVDVDFEYIKAEDRGGKRDNDNFSLIIYPIIPYKNNIRI